MRLFPLLMITFCLAACKPSTIYGPESEPNEELLGSETAELQAAPALYYPAGHWEDGLGNDWNVTVTGAKLTATLGSGNLAGVAMTGRIDDGLLGYHIAYPGSASLAEGQARLIDDSHAQFETRNMDGSLNAHGLLHFNHPAFVPVGQPVELRPYTVGPDTDLTGD
ncbi:MAG: hypothetical protein V7675_11300 [Hyphomonas sp.]|uniref:hypothetical protein n=1 Tax=Hyphomonas sp. TaxID=87 RepID=UPI003001E5D4